MRKIKLLFTTAALLLAGGISASAQTWTGNAPAAETFLLYNVGAEKFINNGDPNSQWGTNAYLQSGFGMDIRLEANEDAYNLNTLVSNGGDNHYLATSTWCDGAPTPWTFEAVAGQANTYTIKNGEKYLVANNDLNDIAYDALTGDNKSWWKLVSLNDFKTAMQNKAYSTTDPMDVSVFIMGRSFARNDGRNDSWTKTRNGGNWTWIGSANDNWDFGNEAYNNTFNVEQTITNLPNGVYEVQCSGFDTHGTTVIFGNSTSTPLQTDNSTSQGTNMAAKWKAIRLDNAFAGQSTGTFLVTDGTIKLGVKRENNNGNDWCVYDEFRLYYYGLDLSTFETQITNLRTQLNGLLSSPMKATVKSAAQDVYDATATVAHTEEAMIDAIANLNTNITNVNTSISNYAAAKAYLDKDLTLDAAGQASFDANATVIAVQAAYDARTFEVLSDEQITALNAAIQTAVRAQTTVDSDWTLAITNPGFELGNTNGWTVGNSTDTGARSTANATYAMANSEGDYLFNTWAEGLPITQTITDLPEGFYEVKVVAARDAGTVFLLANDLREAIAVTEKTTGVEGSIKVPITDGSLTLGTVGGNGNEYVAEGGNWYKVDNFRLYFKGNTVSDEESAALIATIPSGKMKADVKTELDDATTAFEANKTLSNFGRLNSAIAAANNSISAYAKAATAITDANALKDAHNFVPAAAATTFAEAIAAALDGYNNGTLTDEVANNYANLGTNAVGWYGSRAEADYTAAEKYMRSAGFNAEYNDWSIEGVTDGSNFLVPFFQNWTEDANSLANTTITASLAEMPNGLYNIQAWVRVRAKSGTATTAATGITMDVNGGGEGDYAAVDVTEGAQIGESQFQMGTYTAKGLVKDGTLTLNFNITDANISWLSFKNIKYTKERDLLPEELIVYATTDDYTALTNAITAAEAKTIGFEKDEYAPYNNIDALTKLAAAKAIDTGAQNEQAIVQGATTALTGATWTANTEEVNAVYDGTFAAATNDGAPAGWTMSNSTLGGSYHARAFNPNSHLSEFNSTSSGFFLRFDGTNSNRGSQYYYGNAEGYTMPLKANTTYRVTVDFNNWGTTSSKPLRLNVDGPNEYNRNQQKNSNKDADAADNALEQFNIVFTTGEAGNYTLRFQVPGDDSNKHNVIISNVVLKKALVIDEDAEYTPVDATFATVDLKRTFSSENWNTFVVPFDIDNATLTTKFGTVEVAEYSETADGDNSTINFNKMATPAITANVPVLLKTSTAPASVTFDNVIIKTGDAKVAGTNYDFVGTYAASAAVDADDYFIGSNKLWKSTGATTIKGTRAYIKAKTAAARIAGFAIDGEETTAINGITISKDNAPIYNLNGQRVAKPAKGMYVKNGKKVVMK